MCSGYVGQTPRYARFHELGVCFVVAMLRRDVVRDASAQVGSCPPFQPTETIAQRMNRLDLQLGLVIHRQKHQASPGTVVEH